MAFLKKSLLDKLTIGQHIAVSIAYEFSDGYWKKYHHEDFIIDSFSKKEILCTNKKYSRERLRITRKDLDSTRFILALNPNEVIF